MAYKMDALLHQVGQEDIKSKRLMTPKDLFEQDFLEQFKTFPRMTNNIWNFGWN